MLVRVSMPIVADTLLVNELRPLLALFDALVVHFVISFATPFVLALAMILMILMIFVLLVVLVMALVLMMLWGADLKLIVIIATEEALVFRVADVEVL